MLESGNALKDQHSSGNNKLAGPKIALLLLSVLGMGISSVILYLHYRLRATDGNYTSFCNIGGGLNCDRVLTSPYSQLFGYPVELWGLATYLLIAAATIAARPARDGKHQGEMLLVLSLTTWAALFSIYMGAIATFAVGYLCINCVALYLTNFGLAGTAWVWVARAGGVGSGAGSVVGWRQLAYGGLVATLLLASVAALQLRTSATMLGHLTLQQVKEQAPDFYRWYMAQPVVQDLPPARHFRGPADARIRIVEFSDFECGHCRKAAYALSGLLKRYLGAVRLEFRHYPLDSSCNSEIQKPFHRLACSSAVATECAGKQGKFWQYHDLLFSSTSALTAQDLVTYAKELGLDQEQFQQCLKNQDVLAAVKSDIALGRRLNVHSTPTMFINNRMIVGALEPVGYEYAIAIETDRREKN